MHLISSFNIFLSWNLYIISKSKSNLFKPLDCSEVNFHGGRDTNKVTIKIKNKHNFEALAI